MKTTYRRVREFSNDVNNYLHNKPEENKFSYALKKMLKRAQIIFSNLEELLEDARIENCATDDKGIVIRDERDNYKFTKEGLQALSKKQRELLNTEIEIEPYKATEVPDDLTDYYKESFAEFVL